jgi:hypothetical protein
MDRHPSTENPVATVIGVAAGGVMALKTGLAAVEVR